MNNPGALVDRYVAIWNEPDAEVRRKGIREVWASDGAHILEPPAGDAHDRGSAGLCQPNVGSSRARCVEARVTRAHEEFVTPGQFFFRSRGNIARLQSIVKFNWEMVQTSSGEVAGVGLEIFVLDHADRIRLDYQFIEA